MFRMREAIRHIPSELDAVRAEIERLYDARDSGGVRSADQERYDALIATEALILDQRTHQS